MKNYLPQIIFSNKKCLVYAPEEWVKPRFVVDSFNGLCGDHFLQYTYGTLLDHILPLVLLKSTTIVFGAEKYHYGAHSHVVSRDLITCLQSPCNTKF